MEVIAEVGLAHDGSLTQAHAYIEACAKRGVDAVKFQCHVGDPTSEWRVKPAWEFGTRRAYWQRTGFIDFEWGHLAEHCRQARVEFLCSVFSVEGVKLIDPLVKRHKVPSGRINDVDLLHAVAACGKPVILSTGLATYREISVACQRLMSYGIKPRVMECTSIYPCPADKLNLRGAIAWGGLSDHSGGIHAGIAAAAAGCQMLEVHVCWSKEQGTLDAQASLTMDELEELVRGVRFVEAAIRAKDKDEQAKELEQMRRVFMGAA